ncbi:MAG: hypothetical protein CFE23_11110 [Flavobacterium sp. BFFFF1]|uniref:hypothetical protein n=1 Tax=unclassified Flavobacterium TaxID=196869 RepID=UPI000BDDDF93|nr:MULTISPECIES: hypothetical protein [unclassified Flavobacterium]OYU80085.1 MAG: hypothetical protein CFE23_11110 [Flavobacterium sp. BFFFF1]
MKYALIILSFITGLTTKAQDCDYAQKFTDSLGTYRATADYVMTEKNFAGKSAYVFFSLVNSSGTPILKLQNIQKSGDFIKANCFDANSRIYLQLENGKIVTLLHTKEETCGTMMRVEEENKYTRFLSGNFLFIQGGMDDLKTSPVSLLRVKYSTEVVDYIIKKELTSELTGKSYQPARYFLEYLKCIED